MSFRTIATGSLGDLRQAFFDLIMERDGLKRDLERADAANTALFYEANELETELNETKERLQTALRDVEDLEQENFDLQEDLVDAEQKAQRVIN